MSKTLSDAELHEALKNLTDWKKAEDGKSITKTYSFKDFSEAFTFMARIAFHAEKMDHHPEWTNIYNKVHVTLSTHDCKGISAKDITLALHMNEAAFMFLNPCMSNHSDSIF